MEVDTNKHDSAMDWAKVHRELMKHGGHTAAAVVTVAVPDSDSDGEGCATEAPALIVSYHRGVNGKYREYLALLGLGADATRKGWGHAAHPDPRTTQELAAHGLVAFVAEACTVQTEHVLALWDNRGVEGFRAMGDSMLVVVAPA